MYIVLVVYYVQTLSQTQIYQFLYCFQLYNMLMLLLSCVHLRCYVVMGIQEADTHD